MKEAELKEAILASLGASVVCVELSNSPTLFTEVVRSTYQWFNANKGLYARALLSTTAGVNEYTLPAEVLVVMEVITSQPQDWADFAFGDFILGYGGVVIGGMGFGYGGIGRFGGVGGPIGGTMGGRDMLPYSGITQLMQMQETVANIFGAEFEWEFLNGKLIISPIPAADRMLAYDYVKAMTSIEELKDGTRDLDLVVQYAKAEAKAIVGRVRRKYSEMPGADAAISLDGDILLEEAATEKEKLNELIRETAMPMGFFAR